MKHWTILIFGIATFLLPLNVWGQELIKRQQIDSIIDQRLGDKIKLKETSTFIGQFKTYKKVLGLFKVRTKKGEIYHEYIIHDNKLLKHREVQIITRHYGDDFQVDEFYYIDNKLVKCQRTTHKRTKKGDYPKDNNIVYVDNEKIIWTENKTETWTLKYLQYKVKEDTAINWD
jgi:hypothetical protein